MNSGSLAKKIQWFSEGSLAATRSIRGDDFRELGVLGGGQKVANLLFEVGIAFQSQAITVDRNQIFFGAHSYMNAGGYVRSGVFVGRYCSIGRRVSVGAGVHSMMRVSTSPKLHGKGGRYYSDSQRIEAELARPNSSKEEVRNTIIENDVWVGDGVVIVPGVHVSTGAVIGANAVVTHDVDPYTVVAGVPARPLRRRFSNSLIDELLKTEYWDYPTEFIQSLPCSNVFDFLETFNSSEISKEFFDTLETSGNSSRSPGKLLDEG